MTYKQALKLKPGDKILHKYSKEEFVVRDRFESLRGPYQRDDAVMIECVNKDGEIRIIPCYTAEKIKKARTDKCQKID